MAGRPAFEDHGLGLQERQQPLLTTLATDARLLEPDAFTANSPLCGADRIIWASDYPHPDAKFPGVTQELTEALAGLAWDQKRTITSESARALYGID